MAEKIIGIMNTDPIITVQCSTEDWSNLGATSKGIVKGETLEVPIQLGRNEICGMLRIDVKEITDDTIEFETFGSYPQTLKKGGPAVCVTYTVGGYTDHEGCDWDGTDYDYWISWK